MDTVPSRLPQVLRAVDGLAATEAAAVLQQALAELEARQKPVAPIAPVEPEGDLSRLPTPLETPAVDAPVASAFAAPPADPASPLAAAFAATVTAAPPPTAPIAPVVSAPVAPAPVVAAAPRADDSEVELKRMMNRSRMLIGAAIAVVLLAGGGTALWVTLDRDEAPVAEQQPAPAPHVRTRPHVPALAPAPVVDAEDEAPQQQPSPRVHTRSHAPPVAQADDEALPPMPAPRPKARAAAKPVAAPLNNSEPAPTKTVASAKPAAPAEEQPFVDEDLQQLRGQR